MQYTLQEPKTQTQVMTKSPVISSQVQVKSKDEAPVVKNNLAEPEYDFLSKQPAEVVDETYKVKKFGRLFLVKYWFSKFVGIANNILIGVLIKFLSLKLILLYMLYS